MLRLAQVSHALRQVLLSHEEHVYLRHGKNLRQVFHGKDIFDHHRNEGVVIRGAPKVGAASSLAPPANAAMAHGLVLGGIHHRFGLRPRIYMGHDDAFRAAIQRAHDRRWIVRAHADNG